MEVLPLEPEGCSTQQVEAAVHPPEQGVCTLRLHSLLQRWSTSLVSLGQHWCRGFAISRRTLQYIAINRYLQSPLKIKSIRQLKAG